MVYQEVDNLFVFMQTESNLHVATGNNSAALPCKLYGIELQRNKLERGYYSLASNAWFLLLS